MLTAMKTSETYNLSLMRKHNQVSNVATLYFGMDLIRREWFKRPSKASNIPVQIL